MSEIKRYPHELTIGGKECVAFDEDHSLADIARWAMQNPHDGEELHRILSEMLMGRDGSEMIQ